MDISFYALILSILFTSKVYSSSVNSRDLHVVNITRHSKGDFLSIKDVMNCNQNYCAKISNGSASAHNDSKNSSKDNKSRCLCQCETHLKTYREDFGYCVDTIKECTLIPFVSSGTELDTIENIPSVFLPLQGQIVYPEKELLFLNDHKCVIVSANYMTTTHGWSDIKNLFNTNDIPFRLFEDKNRTFLQWSGDTSYRTLLQGRLVILRLACWNGSASIFQNEMEETVRNMSPCVSFRVSGNLLKFTSNVTEVQFSLESTNNKEQDHFSTNEYLIIAISSFCLGLMYVASVSLYIYLKRKKDDGSTSTSSTEVDKNFTRGEADMRHSSYRQSTLHSPPIEFMENNPNPVIKNNPLVNHFMSFNENSAFVSDSSVDDEESHKDANFNENENTQMNNQSENECLPMSITEVSEDKSEMSRNYQNGPQRRKLYFNPAYFEPELLASPPPAAVEFLTKIREVITMAKNKMATKKFYPVLNYISEEDSQGNESDNYSQTMTSKKSIISSRANTKDCSGCPGCKAKNNGNNPAKLKRCTNCGDKTNIIQKWLESVSSASNDSEDSLVYVEKSNDKKPLIAGNSTNNNLPRISNIEAIKENMMTSPAPSTSSKSVKDEISIVKGYVKEKNIFVQLEKQNIDYNEHIFDNGSIPKIVSHSLKKNIKEMIYSQNFVRDKVNAFESKKNEVVTDKLETPHEIYNNPKFNLDHGVAEPSIKAYSSVVKRKQEVLDQYSNPIKCTAKSTNTNVNRMPDMIYEAIEMEKKNKPMIIESPTPDYYSSEYEMTKFKKYDNVSFAPFVPTPDYHTYGKSLLRNMKQYQPDSPIYSRKSPAYLVVDYETDSLERLNTFKKRTVSTPTRSDFSSSQPSPSSALPMEEEVEIRNALYDAEEGFRKDTDTIKKEREIDLQMRKTKIKYNTPNEGSMTIELEAVSPDETNDSLSSTDSDDFEPDTLDRHAKIDKMMLYKKKKFDDERTSSPSPTLQQQQPQRQLSVRMKNENFELVDEKGCLLTLEFRQSKRQRNVGEASLKKLPNGHTKSPTLIKSIPPDVISSSFKKSSEISSKTKPRPYISHPFFADENEVRKSEEFIKMDFLNDYNNHNAIIKTINHVKVPEMPNAKFSIMKPDAFNENVKKTWRRFVGMAFKKHDTNSEEEDQVQNKNIKNVATEIEQGKVKNLIKKMNIVHVHDSGYLSSESLNNDSPVIKTPASVSRSGTKNLKVRPQVPPPPVPNNNNISFGNISHRNNYEDLINITIYSSDDDQNSSIHESDNDEPRDVDTCEDVGADSDFSFVQ